MSSQLKSVVDLLLTGVSSQYIPNGYIAEQIFPFVPVDHYTGKLAKYGLDHVRVELSVAGGKGMYRRVDSFSRTRDLRRPKDGPRTDSTRTNFGR